MRQAAILAMLLCFAGFVLLNASHLSSQTKERAESDGQASETQRQPAIPSINGPTPSTRADVTEHDAPHWYASPEWWLVIAAIPTLFFIGWQASETRRATEAMRDSTDLQKIAMRQWVVLSGWSHNIERHKEGNGTLTITIRIANPTKSPLNLLGYQFDIQGGSNGLSIKHTLLPDEPFAVDFGSLLTSEQLLRRDASGLVLALTGHISFIDALECLQRQTFAGVLRLTPDGTVEFIPRGSAVSSSNESR